MKAIALSTCLQNQFTLQIVDNFDVELSIKENPLNLPIEKLFKMAARVNKKRGFLFVSQVLGKHIPVNPFKPLLTSGLLAMEYYERKTGDKIKAKNEIIDGFLSEESENLKTAYSILKKQQLHLKEEPIIIGFAETATALGHAVFDCMEKAYYISTTREELLDLEPALNFKEEHSHAVDQRCFIQMDVLNNGNPIILVDDEITTGKTALNIIRDIHTKYPRKDYTILSILDWRSNENIEQFRQVEEELGINITTVSLLSGTITFEGIPFEDTTYDYQVKTLDKEISVKYINISDQFTSLPYIPNKIENEHNIFPYVKETGRFGLTHIERFNIDEACMRAGKQLNDLIKGKKTLCLGTGELMYLPMKISSYMGDNIFYHSTTRSPIQPVNQEDYAIKNGFIFLNPEDQRITHYVYNIPKDKYDEVFLFLEEKVSEQALNPLFAIFKDRGIYSINIVTLSNEQKGSE